MFNFYTFLEKKYVKKGATFLEKKCVKKGAAFLEKKYVKKSTKISSPTTLAKLSEHQDCTENVSTLESQPMLCIAPGYWHVAVTA